MSWDHENWLDRTELARQTERRGPMEPTLDHLRLLERAEWSWDEAEFGAPAMDAKRPYGNSNVDEDLAEILPHLTPEDRVRRHCELSAVLRHIVSAYTARLVVKNGEAQS